MSIPILEYGRKRGDSIEERRSGWKVKWERENRRGGGELGIGKGRIVNRKGNVKRVRIEKAKKD